MGDFDRHYSDEKGIGHFVTVLKFDFEFREEYRGFPLYRQQLDFGHIYMCLFPDGSRLTSNSMVMLRKLVDDEIEKAVMQSGE